MTRYLSKLLQFWISFVLLRPIFVLVVAFALAIASIALTVTKLEMLTDQISLISKDHPLVKLSKMLDPFRLGGNSSLAVVVQAPTPEDAVTFINDLSSRIRQDKEHFEDIIVRVDPDAFKSWQLLYLDKKDLLDLEDSVNRHYGFIQGFAKQPEPLGFLKLINNEMASRMVGELFTGFLDEKEPEKSGGKEPLDLSSLIVTLEGMKSYLDGEPVFKSPWSSFFHSKGQDQDLAGYFWEADKRFLVAVVVPRATDGGFLETRGALIRLRTMIRETKASHPGIQAGVTGQEALKNDEVGTVFHDMTIATWLSLAGVFLLLVVFFRSIRRPCLQIITLIAGLCWTFGWTTLFIGHLNILSVVFAPLLCGLGVDYGIHWLARFEEEDFGDRDTRRVLLRVNERSGCGIFLAGLSGALCFLPLVLTDFRGVTEMGLVTGMGLIFTLLATFSVLPALLVCTEGRSEISRSRTLSPARKDLFFIRPHHAGFILAAAAVIAALSTWSASRVYFDPNPLRLQAANAESVIWEKALMENATRSPLYAAAFASSPEEVRTKTAAFEKLASVAQVESIFSILPKDQEAKIPLVHSLGRSVPSIKPMAVQAADDTGEFIDILKRIRFKMQDDQAGRWGAEKPLVEQMIRVRVLARNLIDRLEDGHGNQMPLLEYRRLFAEDAAKKLDLLTSGANASVMTVRDLPAVVRNQFLHDGTYLLQIFPKESIFHAHALDHFVNEIQKVDSQVIGSPVSFYVFANALKRACATASIYSILVIFVLLMISFANLHQALTVLVPLVLGTVWTVGIMGWAGVQFNMANSMFMPLVVGAGVEYGVIILQRWREGNAPRGHLPFSTGKGVIVAALSTTIGFGALMVSQHRGIFSLGFVAWEGSLCVMIAALVIVPAILTFMPPNRSGELSSKDWADAITKRG